MNNNLKKQKKTSLLIMIIVSLVLMNCNSTKSITNNNNTIDWIPFQWSPAIIDNDTLKYGSMEIQGKIKGLDKTVGFQFDLGAVISVIYEIPLKQIIKDSTQFPFDVDWSKKINFSGIEAYSIKNLTIKNGDYTFKNLTPGILKNYGGTEDTEISHIGTIGLDAVKNKYLIIDYKKQKLGITDSLSKQLSEKIQFINFENTEIKQTVFKIDINTKKYNVVFDTGSSSWPIITDEDKFNELLGNSKNIVDSIKVSSWGKEEYFYKSPINSNLKIAYKSFNVSNAYYFKENETSKWLYDNDITAVIGNTLFLDKIIVIDYKNKRFGILK